MIIDLCQTNFVQLLLLRKYQEFNEVYCMKNIILYTHSNMPNSDLSVLIDFKEKEFTSAGFLFISLKNLD